METATSVSGRIFAVVPAAGLSRRMGTLKLALPLGSKTVLERVLDSLARSRVEQTVVVLGPRSSEAAGLVKAPARSLLLHQETPDMRTTVEKGLENLEAIHRPTDADAFLLILADQPSLKAEWIDQLADVRLRRPQAILVPTFHGRRGHPVLFPWGQVEHLRRLPADQGLNRLLRNGTSEVVEVSIDDPEVLNDLDEPADYERAKGRTWD